MANYAAYGSNVNAGVSVNSDNGWGGYKWPGGVPSNLLTSFSVEAGGGTSRLTFRSELVRLVELSFKIAAMHGYTIWAARGGKSWGPWSYENRPIDGTSSASNHSRGRAWDINAPDNPYANPLICDMPPAMVRDFEAVGWSWGGRYEGRKDAMHFEYGYGPGDVAGHVARAEAILGGKVIGTAPDKPAPSTPQDWFDMATKDELEAVVYGLLTRPDVLQNLARCVSQELAGTNAEAGKYPYAAQARAAIAEAVLGGAVKSQVDGQVYAARDYLTTIDKRVLDVATRVRGGDTGPGQRHEKFDMLQGIDGAVMALAGITQPAPKTYIVVKGDTLSGIAKATGTTVADLAKWNSIANPADINVGAVLKLSA